MLIFGPGLEDMPLDEREQVIMVHSGLGTLVLILMLIRWPWRLTHDVPGPAATMGAWQTRLSKIMHWSLYVLLVLQPILMSLRNLAKIYLFSLSPVKIGPTILISRTSQS